MRVISGTAKGCVLYSPKNDITRPTADRVKEAMFSMIECIHEPRKVLDLFAGSGALGIESISRGAESATFVEKNYLSTSNIRENLKKTKLSNFSNIIKNDARTFLKNCQSTFDTIFLDPPYNKNFLSKTINIIVERGILVNDGIIVVESENDGEEIINSKLLCTKSKKYGRTMVSIYKY